MSYDITGSTSQSCATAAIAAPTATVTYTCSTTTIGAPTASWSLGCTTTAIGTPTGSWDLACASDPIGSSTAAWDLACTAVAVGVDTIAGEGSGYVFEEGFVVQTGDPGDNDFVYIRDPETGTDELVSTYRTDSILTFVEEKGVVSLPPDNP